VIRHLRKVGLLLAYDEPPLMDSPTPPATALEKALRLLQQDRGQLHSSQDAEVSELNLLGR
jgi:hypothetical protein